MKTSSKEFFAKKSTDLSLNRWQRMSGAATVAGTAAASVASAGVVQVTLPNQVISNLGPVNAINFDFSGDGIIDGVGFVAFYFPSAPGYGVGLNNGVSNFAWAMGNGFTTAYVTVGRVVARGPNLTLNGLIPVVFTDPRINGGAGTAAFVDINVSNTNLSGRIQIVRSVFNDNGTAAPAGVLAGGTNKEFDPTIYAQRISLANKIKKLQKKAKKKKGTKARKLKKKVKKLQKKLAAIQ